MRVPPVGAEAGADRLSERGRGLRGNLPVIDGGTARPVTFRMSGAIYSAIYSMP
jgi:hypothetical protein